MKFLLLVLAVVLVGCGGGKQEETQGPSQPEPKVIPNSPEALAVEFIEGWVRSDARKPTGELTEADYEKVTALSLVGNGLTEVPKDLEKIT